MHSDFQLETKTNGFLKYSKIIGQSKRNGESFPNDVDTINSRFGDRNFSS